MGSYVPSTPAERQQMLEAIGLKDYRDLYKDVPEEMYLDRPLNIPAGMSELEVRRAVTAMAEKNTRFSTILRGAGAYDHVIPSIVSYIPAKEEFLTAYTPYQAEMSQGVLQSIFEYQTMMCQLTDMDIANASMYDGASAAAEACAMTQDRKHSTIYVSDTVDKRILSVIKTYAFGKDSVVKTIPAAAGATDLAALKETLEADDKAACFLMQYPNFNGIIEDGDAIAEIVHGAGAQLIMSVNPIALGVLKTPGEIGADIVVAEGQPLGLGLAYGGPYLGILATTEKNMRKIVGRLVGETKDSQGERGFVLTLQAREQHIRREKAASNICSNEALCALKASIYLATIGPKGLKQVATLCTSKAHYLAEKFEEIGMKRAYEGEFFHEFVTTCPNADQLLDALEDNGILGGLKLSDTEILWCCTELNSKEDMDDVVEIAKEVFSA